MIWQYGKLASNTLTLGSGMGFRAALQAFVFVAVARLLGTEGYGAFSAILAIASIWSNFCGFGSHIILLRDIARNPEHFPLSWGLTLTTLTVGTLPILLLYLASAFWLLEHVPLQITVALGLAELVFWPFANAAAYAYQGHEQMRKSAATSALPVLIRFIAVIALAFTLLVKPESNPILLWSWLYTLAAFITLIYTNCKLLKDLGKPDWPNWKSIRNHITNGLPYAFLGGASKLHADADKFLIVHIVSLQMGGLYSAAYRLVDLTFLPMQAMISAAVPQLFREGARGIRSSFRASRPLLAPTLAYATIAATCLFIGAPFLPLILGVEYTDSIQMVRWLSGLPLIAFPRLLLQSSLATGNRATTSMAIVFLGAIINVTLNFFWIPSWGWKGAIVATYVAEIFMIISMFSAKIFHEKS